MYHRTARGRTELSMPMRCLKSHLSEGDSVLDYGCGRGTDVDFLRLEGWDAEGYDPVSFPNLEFRPYYDWVSLIYVLNVISDVAERGRVVERCLQLGSQVLVAVRLDTVQGADEGDGVRTSTGSFQCQWGVEEWTSFLSSFYSVSVLGRGVFILGEKTAG